VTAARHDAIRLLIGNKFWFAKGGVETYLFELIEELPALGYEVVPFAMHHERNRPSPYEEFFVDEVDYHAPQSTLASCASPRGCSTRARPRPGSRR